MAGGRPRPEPRWAVHPSVPLSRHRGVLFFAWPRANEPVRTRPLSCPLAWPVGQDKRSIRSRGSGRARRPTTISPDTSRFCYRLTIVWTGSRGVGSDSLLVASGWASYRPPQPGYCSRAAHSSRQPITIVPAKTALTACFAEADGRPPQARPQRSAPK